MEDISSTTERLSMIRSNRSPTFGPLCIFSLFQPGLFKLLSFPKTFSCSVLFKHLLLYLWGSNTCSRRWDHQVVWPLSPPVCPGHLLLGAPASQDSGLIPIKMQPRYRKVHPLKLKLSFSTYSTEQKGRDLLWDLLLFMLFVWKVSLMSRVAFFFFTWLFKLKKKLFGKNTVWECKTDSIMQN